MKTKQTKCSLTPTAINSGFNLGNVTESGHSVYYHLHIDLQNAVSDDEHELIEGFRISVEKRGFPMSWQNFHHLDVLRVGQVVKDKQTALLVSDPTIFGAPLGGHMTLKYTGLPYGKAHTEFISIYKKCCCLGDRLVSKFDQTGYIEFEVVSWRKSITPSFAAVYSGNMAPCPFVPLIPRICLQDVSRKFRTTEVHLTFKDLSLVEPEVLATIFSRGFYTAFRLDKDGDPNKFTTIATIQGFPGEIGTIREYLWEWIQDLVHSGAIRCQVDLKQEDIVASCLLGDPKLQEVIVPDSKLLI